MILAALLLQDRQLCDTSNQAGLSVMSFCRHLKTTLFRRADCEVLLLDMLWA